jgi:hypothetical protein
MTPDRYTQSHWWRSRYWLDETRTQPRSPKSSGTFPMTSRSSCRLPSRVRWGLFAVVIASLRAVVVARQIMPGFGNSRFVDADDDHLRRDATS